MDEKNIRKQIVETGRELLEKKLVARTWGNVSGRLDGESFLITPSGLDYTRTREEDIVKMNLATGEWEGKHRPSGERGVHGAAYQVFEDVEFVIHTHQTYATAIGLAGYSQLDITEKERQRLGGIAMSAYGLPGSAKLTNVVKGALLSGAKVVFMAHHGVLVCGKDKEDAFEKAELLEQICRRNVKEVIVLESRNGKEEAQELLRKLQEQFTHIALVQTPAVLACAGTGKPIWAQVDDMAQMIGGKISFVPGEMSKLSTALQKREAVLVAGLGAIVRGKDADDTAALALLVDKAAVCSLHTAQQGVKARLGVVDVALMRHTYVKKYSRQKDG